MKNISKLLVAILIAALSNTLYAWEPDSGDKLELSVQQAIITAKEKDPDLGDWFESAAGYAVFPRVGKAGIGVGAARGKGLLIQGDETLGEATLTQVSVGLQLGGQVYAE
ncbi:MAG: hypothetical protein GWM87_14655, partial [Xanthomonadales bacterium]|nr:hypothetical protein [Xanthomonadales bacterium]NIX14034.1 hypothetical protein [Xanthomonadales bacterium]